MSDGRTWSSRRLSQLTVSALGFPSPLHNSVADQNRQMSQAIFVPVEKGRCTICGLADSRGSELKDVNVFLACRKNRVRTLKQHSKRDILIFFTN